ncbi:Holliday junction branch migration DNA helicase RuvB [Fluviispira multicolorata]|uniref:Holliday junction branch migration complex subunit RuvB n=1 Tax=Fluviispira multicolorata TaxID=2654512 RepID=A0A833JHH0_9BACT|nr:Holliday junction branch migration DNA helicase RuvB [Fluviispira multicolorata]KAB8033462.1 Holliday junction branch migration DNA helicase RuvB [Fluviispira multicolorata]
METSIHANFESPIAVQELAKETIEPHTNLRPKSFEEYPGQERICENLKIYTKAAKIRGKMLDHCLFHGPPGLGKTTLAGIIAESMDCQIKITSGPVIERAADLMGILASLESRTILFIDEIHRLPANVEEILYSAMEDMRLDILIGQGPTARTVKFDLPPFCLIGATTRAGSISAPLRDRFGIQEHLDYYSYESLTKIILRSAKIMGTLIDEQAALLLAKRCRGTPRIANQLLRRVLDFALVAEKDRIDLAIIDKALNRLGVDCEGLSHMDRDFLRIMHERYEGGPVGLEAISAALNEEKSTLEDVYEPYLVYRGFILRTARGRMLSTTGKEHLKNIQS